MDIGYSREAGELKIEIGEEEPQMRLVDLERRARHT